jgi:hypothetical protein
MQHARWRQRTHLREQQVRPGVPDVGSDGPTICPTGSTCRASSGSKPRCTNLTSTPARPPATPKGPPIAAKKPPPSKTTPANQCPDGCYSDEVCSNRQCVYVGSSTSAASTSPASTGTIAEGESCTSDFGEGSCARGLQCPDGGGLCYRPGSGTDPILGRTGEACNTTDDCVAGLYCPTGGGLCGEANPDGSLMTGTSSSTDNGCFFDTGYRCNLSDGTCVAQPANGSASDDGCGRQCTSDEICTNGYCQLREISL